MADTAQKKRKTPLEERSKILLGLIAIVVISALLRRLAGGQGGPGGAPGSHGQLRAGRGVGGG